MREVNFAIGLVTIDRRRMLEKSLANWRALFPDTPIYVVDQNGSRANEDLYSIFRVQPLWAPYDCGIGAARNRLFREVAEKHLLIADDDDRIPADTGPSIVAQILALMASDSSLLAVGAESPEVKDWDPVMWLDEESRVLYQVPQGEVAPRAEAPDCDVFEADVIHNLAIFNLPLVRKIGAWWDEELKVFEHLPYYVELMKRRQAGENFWVGRTAELVRVSMKRETKQPTTYLALRKRVHFKNVAARKVGADYIVRKAASGEGFHLSWFSRDKHWVQLLGRLGHVFEKAGVKWWLTGDTLIDVMAAGNFAVDSKHISIGVLEHTSIFRIKRHLENEGFVVKSVRGRPGNGLQLRLDAPAPKFGEWLYGLTEVTVTFFSETAGGWEFAVERGRQRTLFQVPPLELTYRHIDPWRTSAPMPVEPRMIVEAYESIKPDSSTDFPTKPEDKFLRGKRLSQRNFLDWVFRKRFWGRRALIDSLRARLPKWLRRK